MFTKFHSSPSQAFLSEGTKVSRHKKGRSAARSLFYSRKSGREYRARAFRQEGIGMKQECNFGFILRRVKRRCLLAAA